MMEPSTNTPSQWLFSVAALNETPSTCLLEKEMYDRARGVEFLYRLGSSLALPTSAMCTAATWFHRFYMRFSMEDFHRQEVAASCIFLATKTEECGRKLRDVARIFHAKAQGIDVASIPTDSKEVDLCQTAILTTEEVLLEALCFDFVVESPHAELLDLFETLATHAEVQEYAWSLAHDSYRTPMCVLYTPRITAIACYVLAQRVFDGPNSPSLDARIAATAPSHSLPTPPSHKPPSPDASRAAIDYYRLNETELIQLSDALSILLEFYSAQDHKTTPYLSSISNVPPSSKQTSRPRLFISAAQVLEAVNTGDPQLNIHEGLGRTPSSSHGGHTPLQPSEDNSRPTSQSA